MIILQFNKKEYKLPTSHKELVLKDYRRIANVDVSLTDIEKYVEFIHILTGIEKEDIKNIDISQIHTIQNNINYLFEKFDEELVDRFILNGVKYGFNKNLDDISFGEYIDMESLSDKNKLNESLHILLAILYRPVIKFQKRSWKTLFNKNKDYKIEKYNSEDVYDRAELFNNELTMDKVMGALVFFSLSRIETIRTMSDYSSNKKMEKMTKSVMKIMGMKEQELHNG